MQVSEVLIRFFSLENRLIAKDLNVGERLPI